MVHSKNPTNQRIDHLPTLMSTAHLPPLIMPQPNSSSSSSDFSLMRDNTQTKLNSIVETPKKVSTPKEVEPQLMSNLEFEPQIQGYFIEPIEQSEVVIPAKKEEKIVITTSETDALYN